MGANLSHANISLVNGTGAVSNADLSVANLRGSLLDNASFAGARLWMADLTDCNLSGSSFEGAFLEGVSIENSIITGTRFELLVGKKDGYVTEFGSCYRAEVQSYKGKENVYAVSSHYMKKARYK